MKAGWWGAAIEYLLIRTLPDSPDDMDAHGVMLHELVTFAAKTRDAHLINELAEHLCREHCRLRANLLLPICLQLADLIPPQRRLIDALALTAGRLCEASLLEHLVERGFAPTKATEAKLIEDAHRGVIRGTFVLGWRNGLMAMTPRWEALRLRKDLVKEAPNRKTLAVAAGL